MIKQSASKFFGVAVLGIMLSGCGFSATNLKSDRNLGNVKALGQITGTKRALLVGVNKYQYIPGLQGCVNDVIDTKEVLSQEGFKEADILTLVDSKATFENIIKALEKVVEVSKPGDFVYFHFSGHGTQQKSTDPDETDGMDEIILANDTYMRGRNDLNNAIVDDDIQSIFGKLKPGVGLIFISDSCHSGTMDTKLQARVRGITLPEGTHHVKPQVYNRAAAQAFKSRVDAGKYTLISGCQDDQTSADAYINERYSGALTYYLLDTLKTGGMQMTNGQWHQGTVAAIAANGYDQVPNLIGNHLATVFTVPD